MPIDLASDGAVQQAIERWRALGKDPTPVLKRWMQFILRKTQRQAPVDKGWLRKSLNSRVEGHTGIIASDRPYARIQDEGGTIKAGRGPLGSKLLAIPMCDEARKMIEGMGTHESLRGKNLTLIKSKSGKLYLVKITERRRAKAKRLGKTKRRAEPSMKIMFLLTPGVRIKGHKYVPSISDADVREFGVKEFSRAAKG